jgi:dihydrofolate synthase/folylpolyglutamate synthase
VDEPLSYLFGLEQFGIKFGLENMRAIAGRLGHPERAFRSVHVAGTNGKGSVTAMVDAGLRAAGYRSARYTSPHLLDLTERFTVDGRPVSAGELAATVARLRGAIEGLVADGTLRAHPTFFEVTTAAAFEIFRHAGVDIAVFEVGLGGRLDATNVLEPLLTSITSIAFDHEHYLGSTIPEIAAEKAGIIKPHVPVVVGDLAPEALHVIEAVARAQDAPVVRALDDVNATVAPRGGSERHDTWGATRVRLRTPAHDYGDVTIGLRGAHQVLNAIVAVRILERLRAEGAPVPADAIVQGIAEPSWPGRLDLRRLPDGRELLLDAAHNPAGAAALASYLHDHPPRLPLVFAAMRDKDTDGMLRALLPVVERVILTRASAARSSDPDALARQSMDIAPDVPVVVAPAITDALDAGWHGSQRIVVAGSIFLLGDVMKWLGGS